ncbi:hypothetical protein NX029_01930 [Cytobacillus firmus]|uniref:hypothetical protein n=1 Tax=Cytobacillus oceanisediminis TaxID=665099 RepID=UPI00203EEA47|nr:hypothetical protein [Cytobacillus oceanisediminis]MCM3246534.1 hypothetical protein [Cytobacillus oceanisediminis]MCS0822710.1 hypothetical protein [Cytobacillus firmus]
MIDLVLSQLILDKHNELILGTNKTKKDRLYKKLENAVTNARSKKVQVILSFLLSKMEKIVTGNIYELDHIRKKFDEYLDTLPPNRGKKKSKERQELYEKLEIFNKEYTYFYNSPEWNAYEFQKEIGVTVCPYCNSQFIFIYESSNGRTRATLDHFFDKGRYPFLAMSIYNLVPSCKICNSDLKGKKITALDTHYSPYEKNISEYIHFRKEIIKDRKEQIISIDGKNNDKDIDFVSVILGYENEYNIKIDIINAPKDIEQKIKGNKDLFHLEKIYNAYHKQYVQDIILKSYIYNHAYRQQLSNTYKVFFNNPQQLRDVLMPPIESDKKNLLGKLTREIIEEETKNFTL